MNAKEPQTPWSLEAGQQCVKKMNAIARAVSTSRRPRIRREIPRSHQGDFPWASPAPTLTGRSDGHPIPPQSGSVRAYPVVRRLHERIRNTMRRRRLLPLAAAAGVAGLVVTAAVAGAAQAHPRTSAAAPAAAAADCSPTQVVANGGFENGSSPWSSSSGVITSGGGESAHGGSSFAWLDGYGTTHTDTLSQSVSIPAGCTTATLTVWLHIDTSETTSSVAYDTLTAKFGSTTLATYSNLDAADGYVQRTYDVSSFIGQTATLNFTGREDSGLQTSFVLDDIAIKDVRDDDRDQVVGSVLRVADTGRVDQPAGEVDRVPHDAVARHPRVPAVQRHPQPDPGFLGTDRVVPQ